jgi:hypothetical protein
MEIIFSEVPSAGALRDQCFKYKYD